MPVTSGTFAMMAAGALRSVATASIEIDRRKRLDADDDVALVHRRHECLADLA